MNLTEHVELMNVNMVTCGGQATIPMVHAVSRVVDVPYAEIVATVASVSAGPGTRANIDEFTRTTSRAIEVCGGVRTGKAIITPGAVGHRWCVRGRSTPGRDRGALIAPG